MREFMQYGDIASVKIMWPRTEEVMVWSDPFPHALTSIARTQEHKRSRNCGFVSFMKRKDAEEAMLCAPLAKFAAQRASLGRHMQGKEFFGQPARLNWSKAVQLPAKALDVNALLGLTPETPGNSCPSHSA